MDNESTVALLVHIPRVLRTRAKVAAARSGKTLTAVVVAALDACLPSMEDASDA